MQLCSCSYCEKRGSRFQNIEKMYIRQTFCNRCKYTSSLTSLAITINGYRKGFLLVISVVLFNNLLQRYLKKLLSSGHACVFSLKL